MASIQDGLGGEEVQPSGLQAGGVNVSPYFIGSVTSESQISGLNIFAQGSGTFGRIVNVNGALLPASTGSPAVFGAFVQAGKAGPLLAATGSIVFGIQFTNQTFVVTVSPSESGTLPWSVSSGTTTYTISGITVNGQSGLSFHWTAIGV